MTRSTEKLVERFTRALGEPVATPEQIVEADGRLGRARFRVFRWPCPVCCAGYDDPLGLYRPLVIDSDDHVHCTASDCSLERIAAEVRRQLDVVTFLDSLGPAA